MESSVVPVGGRKKDKPVARSYKRTTRDVVVIRDDGVQVPADNPEYTTWLADGNTPLPADPDPPPDPVEAADNALLDGLKADYQSMIDTLDAIQVDYQTIIARAATLAGITVTTIPQVQAALRSLGTDLGTLVTRTNQLSQGSERVLRGLAVFVRRTRGL